MSVFVKNLRNEALMPCSERKARLLLKNNKAKIVDYKPFTIQLLYVTGETKQSISLGIDSGAKYIGIAITSENKVISKGTIELRTDVKELLASRKILRRSRRSRKTRYRKCKFKYKTTRKFSIKEGNFVKKKISFCSSRKSRWLPPSIQSRVDNQIFWINKFSSLLPSPKITVEVGKFDTHKLIKPDIKGTEYQEGDAYGFYAVRYAVFARDNYTCQICKKKGGILHTHHITQRKDGGSDRIENLVTVHEECHEKFHRGDIKHKFTKPKQYKETAFMNILRNQVFHMLNCNITYGNITTVDRKALDLEKAHYNDAVAISGIKTIKKDTNSIFYIKQFRKKKRSLHEATPRKGRKEPNKTQKRNSKNTKTSNGFYLNDKVRAFNKIGFISGFTTGGAYIKDIQGSYITIPGKSYKQVGFKNLELISHNNNWQFISTLRYA
ncbi:Paclitaxel/taxanoid biosynthesis susceptibility protein TS1 [Clostridium botulinum]|uniref:RNA-guided endonuclease IscB n=1 Tax=Clostridium botulinum TaxID=1491 RepID=UPI0013758CED|nr:RNA-guided endonuclease IscB [Clostridium botulinum]NCI20703.1 Paclitaxel/taxanoid biosynthesis susceptibility protein TS1 [Clostridium botulinum]NCI35411.1 Paclitaxel/taxanoid biosynthesis susceptibility protein TS1 [Clostridium botulinum]NCI74557.1 Paclitaxel/taxanoid biosynthesis susceptibility protein TS1 [Clostridium botulinum]NDI38110.1 Paclitaxel/taxanoid biosynthesis susceptibility protein TS1 [Clostridium botulinum]